MRDICWFRGTAGHLMKMRDCPSECGTVDTYARGLITLWQMTGGQRYPEHSSSTGKLGFDPDIWNNKLKLSGYVEEAYLTTVPKVPKNPVAGFSKMAE